MTVQFVKGKMKHKMDTSFDVGINIMLIALMSGLIELIHVLLVEVLFDYDWAYISNL